MLQLSLVVGHRTQDLMFALLGFGLTLHPLVSFPFFLSLGIGVFILYQHSMLEVFNFFLYLQRLTAKSLPEVSENISDLNFSA